MNCTQCGRIFNKIRRDICTNCIEAENKAFEVVRDFLRQNPDASMAEVSEQTGVELTVIVALIQGGRLILRDNPNMYYHCERCNAPTQSGRYCSNCSKELADGLSQASNELRNKMNSKTSKSGGYWSK